MLSPTDFVKIVWSFYRLSKRDLPWRESITPYRILVSEVMLQQTQVDRVVDKFRTFMTTFPDFHSLATTPLSSVLKSWQGLGYNRRALYLKKTSEIINNERDGKLPSDLNALQKLPGVGKNTAGAVLAYAFNIPVVFVETNIRSVYLYHFFPSRTQVPDKEILPIIEKTLDHSNPREWYWALMDYGSMLKKIVPNPSRRSATYSRQGAFTGSVRQVRGAILKVVLSHPGTSVRTIQQLIQRQFTSFTPEQLTHIKPLLTKMLKEEILVKEKSLYRIP